METRVFRAIKGDAVRTSECEVCGTPIVQVGPGRPRKTCSRRCAKQKRGYWRLRAEGNCPYCGRWFASNRSNAVTCGRPVCILEHKAALRYAQQKKGYWPRRTRRAAMAIYNQRCAICGADDDLTVDHWVPISAGGDSVIENAVVLCRSCNSKKHSFVPGAAPPPPYS